MLSMLGDALGAIVSGGVTGLLGAGISTVGEYFKNKQTYAHTEKMAVLEQASMKLEAELEITKITTEGEIAQAVEDGKALTASYAHDQATYIDKAKGKFSRFMFTLIDTFRGAIRPAASVYAMVILTWLAIEVFELVGGIEGGLTREQLYTLLDQIILVILYISTTVILWWFGTRQKIIK